MSKFKVGDKVFSIDKGFGTVEDGVLMDTFPVKISFNVGSCDYTACGKRYGCDVHPSLFESPQEASEYFANIKGPIEIDYWINIYEPNRDWGTFHDSKEEADIHAGEHRLDCFHYRKEFKV